MSSENPPQYAELPANQQVHQPPQPAPSQFSTFSGYGLPGVTVAPPPQPTPVLSPIQQPAPVASGPRLNTLEPTYRTEHVQAQHGSHDQMTYQQRSTNPDEKAPEAQKDGCSEFMGVCAQLTCTTIVVTWVATIAACQLTICLMDCMTDCYY